MKPWQTLAHATAPDGTPLVLMQRDREYVIKAGATLLMGSRASGSEAAMAEAGLPEAPPGSPRRSSAARPVRVLIGGLGVGFTVRATLDRAPARAQILVAELVPAIIEWNRGPLAPVAGSPLSDPRVETRIGDVRNFLHPAETAAGQGGYDAILLDVDNGPQALTTRSNRALYGDAGLERILAALAPGGIAVICSAAPDPIFTARLRRTGFDAEERRVGVHANGRGGRHTLFVAQKPRGLQATNRQGPARDEPHRPRADPAAKPGRKPPPTPRRPRR